MHREQGSPKRKLFASVPIVPVSIAPMFFATMLLASTLLISGCFGRNADPTPTPEPIALEFITLNQSPVEKLLAERFTELNPGIEINTASYAMEPADYLRGDSQTPDLMYITPGYYLESAAETGGLTDLSDLWEQTGLADVYPSSITNLSAQEGKQHFFPIGYEWSGLYYNSAVFDELGLTPPATWDELIMVADTLVASGITPFAMAGQDDWLTSLWFSYLNYRLNGPEFHSELMAGRIPYTDSRVVDVFEYWRWMFEQGYFPKNAGQTNSLTSLMSTVRGDNGEIARDKTAMILASPSFLEDIPRKFRDELDFVPFPMIDQSLPVGEVVIASGYMVPSAGPHREEVLDYLTFVASEEGMSVLADQAQFEEIVPAAGLAGLESVPDSMRRGFEIIENADAVDVAYIFGIPLEMQTAFEQTLNAMLREVDSTGTFDTQAATERLEAANAQ
jgi:ABC-type glycerol-3-phosphate transport system substrate-binding protein